MIIESPAEEQKGDENECESDRETKSGIGISPMRLLRGGMPHQGFVLSPGFFQRPLDGYVTMIPCMPRVTPKPMLSHLALEVSCPSHSTRAPARVVDVMLTLRTAEMAVSCRCFSHIHEGPQSRLWTGNRFRSPLAAQEIYAAASDAGATAASWASASPTR